MFISHTDTGHFSMAARASPIPGDKRKRTSTIEEFLDHVSKKGPKIDTASKTSTLRSAVTRYVDLVGDIIRECSSSYTLDQRISLMAKVSCSVLIENSAKNIAAVALALKIIKARMAYSPVKPLIGALVAAKEILDLCNAPEDIKKEARIIAEEWTRIQFA